MYDNSSTDVNIAFRSSFFVVVLSWHARRHTPHAQIHSFIHSHAHTHVLLLHEHGAGIHRVHLVLAPRTAYHACIDQSAPANEVIIVCGSVNRSEMATLATK